MYEFLKRENRDPLKNSEAVTHEELHSPEKNKDIPIHGLDRSAEEKEKDPARELGRVRNAYNNVSIGADKQGNIILSAAALRRENSPTLDNDKKRLRTSRARKKTLPNGEFFSGSRLTKTGAFAFKADKKVPEIRILRQIKEHSRRYDIMAVNNIMPFMSVENDIERLQTLCQTNAPQNETAALESAVTAKKAEMKRFLRTLKTAKRNAKKIDEPVFQGSANFTMSENQTTISRKTKIIQIKKSDRDFYKCL